MESSDNNNDQLMFLSQLKELWKELLAVKKRIVQLEESNEKKQERLDNLERENYALKTQLNIDGKKEGESALKRKRTEKDQVHEKETESKPVSVLASADKKKTKTNNNKDNDEAVVLPVYDNGDSFDSLSDDLLHKVVEFDGNCYEKFGSINKRCKNIYDVEEYKLKKQTCVYGYGTIDMMLEHYLQKRREGERTISRVSYDIARAVVWYNRLDAIDWMIQLGDTKLLQSICCNAAGCGKINILSKVFLKSNITVLDRLTTQLCYEACYNGHLETLKWLRKYGCAWGASFIAARFFRDNGSPEVYDEMLQYLIAEGCPELLADDWVSSNGYSAVGFDDEDGDY